ncbi:hypothetical protein Bbelb_082640 [Branchiostoma belcheri]|nr:hypothetical protein Bbelb_082640 [Branchiostoma belcheri]
MQEPREVEAREWEDRDSIPPPIPPQQNTAEDMTPEEEPDSRKGSQNETLHLTPPILKRKSHSSSFQFNTSTRTEEHEDIQDHSNETSSSSKCTYKTTLCQNLQGILGECSSLKDLDEARQQFKLRPSLKEYCKKEEVDRGNHGPSCTANFPLADPIGNAEEELARRAVVDMQGDPQNPVLLDKFCTPERPVLLLLDQHAAHVTKKAIEAVEAKAMKAVEAKSVEAKAMGAVEAKSVEAKAMGAVEPPFLMAPRASAARIHPLRTPTPRGAPVQ